MAKIINFEKYLKNRPTKGTKKPEDLDKTVVILLEFLDDEKTSSSYDMIGNYNKTKLGRAILGEALLLIAQDILYGEDPTVIHEMLDTMKESLKDG